MDDLHLRPARATDRDVLVRFHRALYIDHRDSLVGPEIVRLSAYENFEAVLAGDVASMLASRDVAVLVAERADELIGYITGRVENEPRRVLPRRGVVEDWYVVPAHRKTQVGRRLFDALLEIFRAQKCDLVESSTWAANTGARAAHERLGFHPVQVTYRMAMPDADEP